MQNGSLAQRLRMARAYRGWSQTELASRSKVHKMQISKLERGVIKETSTGTLRALCKALGVSADYLLGRSENMGITDVEEDPVLEELTHVEPWGDHLCYRRPRSRKAAPVG